MAAYLLGSHTELGHTFVARLKPEVERKMESEKGCNCEIHVLFH